MGDVDRAALAAESRGRLEFPKVLDLIAAYAQSRPGKEAVAAIVPLADPSDIAELLALTGVICTLAAEGFSFRLDGLQDLAPFLAGDESAAARPLSPDELAAVARTMERSHALGATLRGRADLPHVARAAQEYADIPELREALAASIDPQGGILATASRELAELRARAEQKERWLRQWMERHRDAPSLRGVLQGSVVSIRNGRFVFAVREDQRHRVQGVVHDRSASGSTLFVEPQQIILHGNELEDLRARARREEARILVELTIRVRAVRAPLLEMQARLAKLDAGAAKARFAIAFGCNLPEVGGGRALELAAARHPLLLWRERDAAGGIHDLDLERARERVVPLDVALGKPFFQIVITGPNTGGKTVVLKTIGLLALMAASAIPIPAAAGSTIPCFREVLADIGDEQSLEQNLSTFSSHMSVIARILRVAGSQSLVLLDELGAGTDPFEGASLAEAILDSLYARGVTTCVTTHLGRLKEFAFRRRKCANAAMEFDAEKLAPTFRLLVGVPGRSNALIIARRLGVLESVVAAAEKLLAASERIDPEVLAGMERARGLLDRQRAELEAQKRDTAGLRREAEAELEHLHAMRKAIEHEAERAEEERVLHVIGLVEEALARLGDPPREQRPAFDALRRLLEEARQSTSLGARRAARAQALRKGDPVFVPRYKQICEVQKLSVAKRMLTVTMNGMAVEVPFAEISWVLPPPGYQLEWYQQGV